MSSAYRSTRSLALGLFAFVGIFAAIVWYLVRPYGGVYFFPVHFLVALGLPFGIYAIGASRGWFWLGLAVTAGVLVWLNLWGHDAGGLAPRTLDWSHVWAGVLGLALAFGIEQVYRRVRPPHRGALGR